MSDELWMGDRMAVKLDRSDHDGILSTMELNGILQRLALYEIPDRVAKGYGVPISLVMRVREEYAAQIVQLRRDWRRWISTVEPLCNKNNMVIFLGNLARMSAKEKDYRTAITAAKEVRAVMEREEEETSTLDQAIMDRIMSGEFEDAAIKARMIETENFTELAPDETTARKSVAYLEDRSIDEIDELLTPKEASGE